MTTAQNVKQSPWYEATVTPGLIAYGVVHLLIAWIALQLAWGKSSSEASQQGALEELAGKPLGHVLLWIVAIGLFALVASRVIDLFWGHLKTSKKLSSIGRAVVYVVLGVDAVRVAAGGGGSSSNAQRTVSARLMAHGAGRVLIIAIGLVVVAIGIAHLYKAVTKKFAENLTAGVSEFTVLVGRIGYAVKGIAFLIVGGLFVWAALAYDPQKAGGLDTALHTIKDQPFGSVLLTALAAGIAVFGLYAFAWSRNARH